MKDTLKNKIREINSLACNMPKTINEAMEYCGYPNEQSEHLPDENMEAPVDNEMEIPADAPQEAPKDMPDSKGEENDGVLNVEEFVDDIRKKALRGMAQLADNPDDERYQLLKKIWQICDKKPEQQTAFSNPNQQMQKKF